MPREHLDSVGELEEPVKRVEHALGTLGAVDREVRSRSVTDEERVAGEEEPRLVGARVVDHREAAVLGPMARGVDAAQA